MRGPGAPYLGRCRNHRGLEVLRPATRVTRGPYAASHHKLRPSRQNRLPFTPRLRHSDSARGALATHVAAVSTVGQVNAALQLELSQICSL